MMNISQASAFVGVSQVTLRRWERQGKIYPEYTLGGHRRYSRKYLIQMRRGNFDPISISISNNGITYIYARVSTYKQKKAGNLDRQSHRLLKFHEKTFGKDTPYKLIEDYGSGLNSNRRGLTKLISDVQKRVSLTGDYFFFVNVNLGEFGGNVLIP